MDQSFSKARLEIDAYYHSILDIRSFALMLKDPAYCYKFYWLEALVILISEGVKETTFNEIIDEMICRAWYSVREFHIHLSGLGVNGEVKDGLERAILKLTELSDLPSGASKVEIKNAIRKHDAELYHAKEQLTHMVPYRALAGFFANAGVSVPWDSNRKMISVIESFNESDVILPYTLGTSSGLRRELRFHPSWIEMIQDHTVSILGWIQYEKVKWLQNNNPEVPGLIYKLLPMDEKIRKLNKVRKLWEGVLEIHPITDLPRCRSERTPALFYVTIPTGQRDVRIVDFFSITLDSRRDMC